MRWYSTIGDAHQASLPNLVAFLVDATLLAPFPSPSSPPATPVSQILFSHAPYAQRVCTNRIMLLPVRSLCPLNPLCHFVPRNLSRQGFTNIGGQDMRKVRYMVLAARILQRPGGRGKRLGTRFVGLCSDSTAATGELTLHEEDNIE